MTISCASRESARRISTFCCSAGPQLLGGRVAAEVEAGSLRRARRSARFEPARADEARRAAARRRARRFPRRSAAGRRSAPGRSRPRRARAPRAASRTRPARLRAAPARRPARERRRRSCPSVDLPAPFSPTSAWTEPRATPSETRVERLDASEVLGDVQELEVGSFRLAYGHRGRMLTGPLGVELLGVRLRRRRRRWAGWRARRCPLAEPLPVLTALIRHCIPRLPSVAGRCMTVPYHVPALTRLEADALRRRSRRG